MDEGLWPFRGGIALVSMSHRSHLPRPPQLHRAGALWGVVLFRLLCPISIPTEFSLLGLLDSPVQKATEYTTAVEYVPHRAEYPPNGGVQLPVTPIIRPTEGSEFPQENAVAEIEPVGTPTSAAEMIWLMGVLGMLVYSSISYFQLRRRLIGTVLLRDNIYLADGIETPFVMGCIRPKIYLPSILSEQEQGYIVLHEQHHIHRGDHLLKALAFLALSIHWFNPLVWVAFVLSSKDMEMSCDEAVVRKLGEAIRADYSSSLLIGCGRETLLGATADWRIHTGYQRSFPKPSALCVNSPEARGMLQDTVLLQCQLPPRSLPIQAGSLTSAWFYNIRF